MTNPGVMRMTNPREATMDHDQPRTVREFAHDWQRKPGHPRGVAATGRWAVAADICAALDIRNSRDAVTRLDAADVATADIRSGA